MIRETGKIIAIEKQHAEKVAIVECISKSACSSCNHGSSCGVGAVSKAYKGKTHQFELPYKEGMEIDEVIEFQINDSDLIKSSILAYLVPLVFFIGGALLAKQFDFISEGLLILIAVVFAAVGFLVTRLVSRKLFSKEAIIASVTTKQTSNEQ